MIRATTAALHTTTTTSRFPNSMRGWSDKAGVMLEREQSGQSGHPRPESDRRTAAPVTMLSATRPKLIWQRRRKAPADKRGACTGEPSYWCNRT